jgi:hypothetical protein
MYMIALVSYVYFIIQITTNYALLSFADEMCRMASDLYLTYSVIF